MTEKNFEINKVYTKDISAESPNAPGIYRDDWEPEISLNLGNSIQQLAEEDFFEVTLSVTVTAKLGEKTAYIVEVEQAGLFTIAGFDESEQAYMIGAMVPNILFPYARETISNLSQKLGFPPMLLNPIDFNGLFQQHLNEKTDEIAADTENTDSEVEKESSVTKH